MRQEYGYESPIAEMWRVSDLVEGLIFIALAVMLAYTVFVTVRFFRRYSLACRESSADLALASQQSRKNVVAELGRGVGTLKAIALAAPYLGLVGTCYGILCVFFRGFYGLRGIFVAAISLEMSTTLIATTAGLIVAIPAAISYNVLRTRLEKFGRGSSNTLLKETPRTYGFAQTLPLQRRFSGLPAFALVGAPILGMLVPMFALMLRSPISVGLPVRLMRIGVSDQESAPIVISVIYGGPGGPSEIFVNSREVPWNELGNALRMQLQARPHWVVYVEGEKDVPWADVANAIDVARGLHADVVLLTETPRIDSDHQRKTKDKGKMLIK